MAALNPVTIHDTWDIWRQKINAIATRANNISAADDVFELQDPINDQDILVYDEDSEKFTNVTTAALVAAIMANMDVSQLKPFFMSQQRNVF